MTEQERVKRATDELLKVLDKYDVILGVDLSDGVHVYILSREEADGPKVWMH